MTSTTISGAELKVQLTGLGLTPVWFAERLQVTPRTVVRWFGCDSIPRYAAVELDRVREATAEAMHHMISAGRIHGTVYTQRTDPPGVQELNTLPAAWHRALTFRVLEILRNDGRDVAVAYTPKQAS